MVYNHIKDLPRNTASGKSLRDKSFNLELVRNIIDIKEKFK